MTMTARATTWNIETDALAITWEESPAGDVLLSSLRAAGREWLSEPVTFLGLAGESKSALELRDVSGQVDGETLRLRGRIEPGGLILESLWTVHAKSSIVVAEFEVINETGEEIDLGSLSSLRLLASRDGDSTLSVLAGGRWDESMPPRGYRLQTFDLATINRHWFGAAADGRSSGEYVPWFALTNPAGGGLLAGLVWSGRWRLDAHRVGESVALTFGISEFGHRLRPGARISLPGIVLAGFAGDLDDGSNTWREWLRTTWMPPTPENWPWVQYNHWYAYFGDIDEVRLFEEARYAATAGCEVFVIDDGWFEGRRPDSYVAGWGNWREDRARFPSGLQAFGDRLRTIHMKFGLWVEPERADETGELVRNHPEWVATRDREPIYRHGPSGLQGVHLCLGNPDVQQWMTEELIRVVRDYGVDWIKWDYNMGYGLGCNAPNHGHQGADGHHAHTIGLYRVLAEVRAACPALVIENCASGGHRVDLGTLRQTHTNWLSDYTYRAASCRQHVQGAGMFLPLAHLNSWTLAKRDANEFRSRMGGAFGVSDFMGNWSNEERQALALAIGEYKRLRPFLTGERFLLTGPLHQDWEVWQFVHPTEEKIALLVFRDGGAIDQVHVYLRNIDAHCVYELRHEDDPQSSQIDGAALSTSGMQFSLPQQKTSALIWITGNP
ncbi:MAG: glycoside hydrolase family 36 protein [Thermomicrobiales bacterium]